jgi:hypothetical protein
MSLLLAIETCLKLTNLPPSRFGRESVKDPRLVHDLRLGRQPGAAIERRVRAYIARAVDAVPDSERKVQALRRLSGILAFRTMADRAHHSQQGVA